MKAAFYSWGEYEKMEEISQSEFKTMRALTKQEILGFQIRKEDKGKKFYGYEEYIDAGADGIAVKFAYAKMDTKTK